MSDTGLLACGLMVHALRGHQDAAQLLLDSLTDDQARQVALQALEGLGLAVRAVDATETAEHIALGIQEQIYEQEGADRG